MVLDVLMYAVTRLKIGVLFLFDKKNGDIYIFNFIFPEMLTCALKPQVNDLNREIIYWNVCISFNLYIFNQLNAQTFIEYFFFSFLNMCPKGTS
jgi:hypothetical protein